MASLDTYNAKRDFKRTSEPAGRIKGSAGGNLFVIQKHDASRLHYDLRLEVDGVLKSWAVPKGASMDPKDKRLAVATEDHPMDYASFEGVIPKGEYGAGRVIVWDQGAYVVLPGKDGSTPSLAESIRAGHFKVRLTGTKLRGGFAMTRTKGLGGRDGEDSWILVKIKDEAADPSYNPVRDRPESVLSGRTLDELE